MVSSILYQFVEHLVRLCYCYTRRSVTVIDMNAVDFAFTKPAHGNAIVSYMNRPPHLMTAQTSSIFSGGVQFVSFAK